MQEQAFLPVHPKRTKIPEALFLLRHTAILRTVRKIDRPKDIEQPSAQDASTVARRASKNEPDALPNLSQELAGMHDQRALGKSKRDSP